MKSASELQNLDNIASDSLYGKGIDTKMVDYSYRVLSRHIKPGSILELGPAEGVMTGHLAGFAEKLTVVEGAQTFCESLRERFPTANVVHSLFEDFKTTEAFDSIILGHVLEHVEEPVAILNLVKGWLKAGGRVIAAVPNARSLHRQAAVEMGLLPFEEAMNDADRFHGHRRIFNPETFRQVFRQAGLTIEFFGGYWLKPVSNRQVEESWTPQMVDAFITLGERYPDIAAEIYIVAGEGQH